jgi:hypothetical protein
MPVPSSPGAHGVVCSAGRRAGRQACLISHHHSPPPPQLPKRLLPLPPPPPPPLLMVSKPPGPAAEAPCLATSRSSPGCCAGASGCFEPAPACAVSPNRGAPPAITPCGHHRPPRARVPVSPPVHCVWACPPAAAAAQRATHRCSRSPTHRSTHRSRSPAVHAHAAAVGPHPRPLAVILDSYAHAVPSRGR